MLTTIVEAALRLGVGRPYTSLLADACHLGEAVMQGDQRCLHASAV